MAYGMAGLGPKDMDFAEIYDCFTITAMITLEDYGFCAKGEGKDFGKEGRIGIGGELPLNTHGGLLSQAHLEGQLHITEAVKQLRGNEVEAERQVVSAEVGIVSGHGGSLAMHATLILGASCVKHRMNAAARLAKANPSSTSPKPSLFGLHSGSTGLQPSAAPCARESSISRHRPIARVASHQIMNG